MNEKDAAKAWTAGALKAMPRVVGAERPSTLLTIRVMGKLLRAAFLAGAEFGVRRASP